MVRSRLARAGRRFDPLILRSRSKPDIAPGHIEKNESLITDLKPAGHLISYTTEGLLDEEVMLPSAVTPDDPRKQVRWFDIVGLGEPSVLVKIAESLSMHRLAIEDVAHTNQRPKVEEYGDAVFIVMHLVHLVDDQLSFEQLSVWLCGQTVVTFQERPGDPFEPVRERIRRSSGRLRQRGADYLLYALLDVVVDSYFPILEHYGDRIAQLEDDIIDGSVPNAIEQLHEIRRDLLAMRRMVQPMRTALMDIQQGALTAITDETRLFLRDAADHGTQLMDAIDSYRDLAAGATDTHLSLVGQRTNEIMRVLTIFAAVFIPLGFIAGVFGMNFDQTSPYNMPELRWRFGYPTALLLMLFVALGLVFLFWRRGWIGGNKPSQRAGRKDPPEWDTK
ncbi:MAG: magnesium/cobalt transporter CorA [Phycisphaerales bacterium]|nr:magnesium/cobalt transporter CorA [Phycisphaerales bacterium]